MLAELTNQDFEAKVLASPVPVLVDFWAVSCGGCQMISKIVEQVAEEMVGVASVFKYEIKDVNDPILARYKVSRLPTLHFFKGGELKDTIVGTTTKSNITNRLQALV